jgi:pimeloyl-ACP methyl ester carboxylesterase
MVDLDGLVHVADFGGEGPSIVLVHGLGGSHVNWLSSGTLLARTARVVALDLVAFGRTPPEGRSAGIAANADLLADFIDSEMGGSAVVVGNSMGGLVSLIAASRRPESIAGLVLVDAALPRPTGAGIDRAVATAFVAYAVPGFGEVFLRARAARLGPERYVRQTLSLVCADASRVPPEIIDAHIAFARERFKQMPWSDRIFLDAARSLMITLAAKRRFYATVDSITAPGLIVQGALDRLVPVEAARALSRRRPDWDLEIFDDVGHAPQLEVPERFVATVQTWLAGAGKAAAIAATA